MTSYFEEDCPDPAGTVIMRRFLVGEYRIVYDLRIHQYVVIDSKMNRILESTNYYMDCLNWCVKHGCGDQIQK